MSWLSDNTANRFKESYTKGFLDISGSDLVLRNGNIDVSGSIDISNNVSIQGDVSLNNNLTIDGNLEVLDITNVSILNTTIEDSTPTIAITGDLSLNGTISLSGSVRPATFFDVNSGSLPYIVMDFQSMSASHNGSFTDIRNSFVNLAKKFTNINSSQFQMIQGAGGLSNGNDPDHYIGFRVFPGLWEGTFYIKPTQYPASNHNTQILSYLYLDTNDSGTTNAAYTLGYIGGNSAYNRLQYGHSRFKFIFYVPDGPSGYYRLWNNSYDTRTLSGFRITNTSTTQSANNYPYFELNCLHVGNWNGVNPGMQSISGSNPSYVTPSDIQFSPGAASFSSTI
jgi:hypothetical protein